MKKFLFLISFVIIFSSAFSQGWEKKYNLGGTVNADNVEKIIELNDGGYAFISDFGPIGGWALALPNASGAVTKIDSVGNIVWTTIIPAVTVSSVNSFVFMFDITELRDSSLMIIGYNGDDSITNSGDFILKVDKNGNVISQTIDTLAFSHNKVLTPVKNNSFYLGSEDTCHTNLFYLYPCITKFDGYGNKLWSFNDTTIEDFGNIVQMTVTADSGVVATYYNTMSSGSRIFKVDKNGNFLWDKLASYASDILGTPNNTIILATYEGGFFTPQINILEEYDANGDSIWSRSFSYYPEKVVSNNYGGYTIMGRNTLAPGLYGIRTYLVAYDSLWNTVWERFDDNDYKVSYNANYMHLFKTDNGYMFGGSFVIPDAYDHTHSYVVKTDSLGQTYKGNISGTTIEDDNTDCIFNGIDYTYKNILIEASNGSSSYYAISQATGEYSIKADTGNYVVTHTPKNYRTPICPSSGYAVVVVNPTDTINGQDFFDHLTSNFTDAAIDITPGAFPVPGFDYTVYINYNNIGTDTINGTVTVTYDSLLSFISSSVTPVSTSYHTLTFNYNSLAEDSSGVIQLTLHLDSTIVLGETLDMFASISTLSADIDSANNIDVYTDIVVGAFDPNDKAVNPKGIGVQGFIVGTEILEYTIRFQNTGTLTANNVIVRDSISDNLDMNTFTLLSSSHTCVPVITGLRNMNFKFLNINLPDSTSNEPASHGYVKYSIKPKAGIAAGTQIKNTAYIYFDFNYPIITNTTLNTIAFPASIEEVATTNGSVIVYPNPFSDNTTFVIKSDKLNELYSFELTDVLGKKVKSKTGISEKQFEISRDGLENGIYFYKIYTAESVIGIGKVVIK